MSSLFPTNSRIASIDGVNLEEENIFRKNRTASSRAETFDFSEISEFNFRWRLTLEISICDRTVFLIAKTEPL